MPKVLITGVSGFIGQNLLEELDEFTFHSLSRPDFELSLKTGFKAFVHLAGLAHDLNGNSIKNEYLESNYLLTIKAFQAFLDTDAKTFIFFSTSKVYDENESFYTENSFRASKTPYGESKNLAEDYLQNQINNPSIKDRKIFILRPCMVHGKGNKGNLRLMIKWVDSGLPWLFEKYENNRSYCSVNLLGKLIRELINNADNHDSGPYNCADKGTISSTELFRVICESRNKKFRSLKIPKSLFHIPINLLSQFGIKKPKEILQKITSDFVLSTEKLENEFPHIDICTCSEELRKSLETF